MAIGGFVYTSNSNESSVLNWGLRKYDIPDCAVIKGQYGLEPSYKDYIEHTRLWCKEAWRVLCDDGLLFLNLGDSYCSGNRAKGGGDIGSFDPKNPSVGKPDYAPNRMGQNLPDKCKILVPHRVAIALIDDGWILRNGIVWYKPNAMPESCKDRFSKKSEYIFMLSKKEKYYFDLDAVREEHQTKENRPMGVVRNREYGYQGKYKIEEHESQGSPRARSREGYEPKDYNPKGKNPGDMWQFNTQPSTFKHYAMWPQKLVKRMILCSTKVGNTVLDPFCGSGTTLRIAESLKRTGLGIDLGYTDIQEQRLKNIQEEMYV